MKNLVSDIIEDLQGQLQVNPPPRSLVHRQKDYLLLRKDLWTRYGGALPLPAAPYYSLIEEEQCIKVLPKLSKVAGHLLTAEFFARCEKEVNHSSPSILSSSSSPLTQTRVRLAREVLGNLGASVEIRVEPVLDSERRRVHMATLKEFVMSMGPVKEGDSTFGQLVKDVPCGEVTFKLLSCSLSKPVVVSPYYSSKLTFILYNAARIKQILDAYRDSFGSFSQDVHFESLDEEGTLIVSYLSKYPDLLREIRAEGTVHRLPLFLTDFVGEFSRYYRTCRIIRESPHLRQVMDAKIHFLRFVLYFLHHSLCLLNIDCLQGWTEEYCQIFRPDLKTIVDKVI